MENTHKYKVGDKVEWINPNGVDLGEREIIGLEYRNGPTYFINPTDAPWFSVAEENLYLI